jgi:hypothetical protein
MINIQLHKILDVSLCWDILRSIYWENGVICPSYCCVDVVKNGKYSVHKEINIISNSR